MPDPTTRAGGEGLADQLKQILCDHIADEVDAWGREERPDLWDQTVEVPVALVAAAILALRSTGTDGGTQGAGAFRVGRRVPENVYRDGKPWLSAGTADRATSIVTACESSAETAAQIDHAARAFHADLDAILAGNPRVPRTTDGGEA